MAARIRPNLELTMQHDRIGAMQRQVSSLAQKAFDRGYVAGALAQSRWWLIAGFCIGALLGALATAGAMALGVNSGKADAPVPAKAAPLRPLT